MAMMRRTTQRQMIWFVGGILVTVFAPQLFNQTIGQLLKKEITVV